MTFATSEDSLQDAYRPFSKHLGPHSDIGGRGDIGGAGADPDFNYRGVPDPDDAGFDHGTIEDASVLESVKRVQEAKKEGFVDKLKFWEETRPRQEDYDLQLQVRKICTSLHDYHRDYKSNEFSFRARTPPCGGHITSRRAMAAR